VSLFIITLKPDVLVENNVFGTYVFTEDNFKPSFNTKPSSQLNFTVVNF